MKTTATSTCASLLSLAAAAAAAAGQSQSCDTVQLGYACQPSISQFWGQYSAYFSVASTGNGGGGGGGGGGGAAAAAAAALISPDPPSGCQITFAQILSRHGARDPTASKTTAYNATISSLQANVSSSAFTGKYAFLADYEYSLGADLLTTFGQQELINSGTKFAKRYASLAVAAGAAAATNNTPPVFVRSSSQVRVVESAQNWTQGFHAALVASGHSDPAYPYSILEISEASGSNNTLNHGVCTNFESDDLYYSSIADNAQARFAATFVPAIRTRLEADLPGAQLSTAQVIYLMDLCPFNTVASTTGKVSPFCAWFSEAEWHAYNYYETLNKYYGYGAGNPLGPTQGVGWTNELIARLTGQPVQDSTSTNRSLDSDPATFPLGRPLYADFTHDNAITAIVYALGLYNNTPVLSNTTITEALEAGGYSASWTVPFAARLYVEKMTCSGSGSQSWSSWNSWGSRSRSRSTQQPGQPQQQELVRVLVNDRVIPLVGCGADALGRCTLDAFIQSLSFARSGGRWSECFA